MEIEAVSTLVGVIDGIQSRIRPVRLPGLWPRVHAAIRLVEGVLVVLGWRWFFWRRASIAVSFLSFRARYHSMTAIERMILLGTMGVVSTVPLLLGHRAGKGASKTSH